MMVAVVGPCIEDIHKEKQKEKKKCTNVSMDCCGHTVLACASDLRVYFVAG